MRAVLPVAKQNAISAGTSPSDDSIEIMREDAERLHAGARRRVGAEDHALELAHVPGGAQGEEGGALVAVVHESPARAGSLRRCNGSARRAARCGRH